MFDVMKTAKEYVKNGYLFTNDVKLWIEVHEVADSAAKEFCVDLKLTPKKRPVNGHSAAVVYLPTRCVGLAIRFRESKADGGTWLENSRSPDTILHDLAWAMTCLKIGGHGGPGWAKLNHDLWTFFGLVTTDVPSRVLFDRRGSIITDM